MPRRPTGRPPGRPRHPETLTPAEQRVLSHLREGLPNAEIGVRLGISPDAVKYHVSNMLGKLELESREQLAAWREPAGLRRLWLGVPVALNWAGGAAAAVTVVVVGAALFARSGDAEPEGPLDLYTGIITLNLDGEPSNGQSWFPSMSADGRYVAFESTASDLVPNDTNGVSDIFVFDRHTREMRRISVGLNGGEANGASYRPSISADGRFVAFDSEASNLVEGDNNHTIESIERWAHPDMLEVLTGDDRNSEILRHRAGGSDVFVADLRTGRIELASISSSGEKAGLGSFWPSMSGDGQLIVFQSNAPNLDGEPRDYITPPVGVFGFWGGDIFLRDRESGKTTRISEQPDGTAAEWGSGSPVISTDGRHIAFVSRDATLAAGEGTMTHSIYLYDRERSAAVRVPMPAVGEPGAFQLVRAISRPAISDDGQLVAYSFSGAATGGSTIEGVFVANMDTGDLRDTGATSGPVHEIESAGFAPDGALIVHGLVELPVPHRTTALGPGAFQSLGDFSQFGAPGGGWWQPAFSADGNWVAGVYGEGRTSNIAVVAYADLLATPESR